MQARRNLIHSYGGTGSASRDQNKIIKRRIGGENGVREGT